MSSDEPPDPFRPVAWLALNDDERAAVLAWKRDAVGLRVEARHLKAQIDDLRDQTPTPISTARLVRPPGRRDSVPASPRSYSLSDLSIQVTENEDVPEAFPEIEELEEFEELEELDDNAVEEVADEFEYPELSLDDIVILELDDEDIADSPTTFIGNYVPEVDIRGIELRLHSGGRVEEGFTTDLTEKGLFAIVGSPPDVGARVDVEIFLSADKSFRVAGVVRRHGTGRALGQWGCGVSFEAASAAIRARILALVHALGSPTR